MLSNATGLCSLHLTVMISEALDVKRVRVLCVRREALCSQLYLPHPDLPDLQGRVGLCVFVRLFGGREDSGD